MGIVLLSLACDLPLEVEFRSRESVSYLFVFGGKVVLFQVQVTLPHVIRI